MKLSNMCVGAVLFAATVSGVASADVVNLAYQGKERGQSVKLDSTLFSGNVFAGQLVHTITGGSPYDGTWITFCTDLSQHVSSAAKPFDIVSVDFLPGSAPMGLEKANAIRDIYASAGGAQLLAETSNAFAAAFQLAIWEIILDFDSNQADRGLNIATGDFKAMKTNGDALSSTITGHLATLFGSIGVVDASGIDLVGFTSGQHQDQLIVVPAPGALALLASAGMLALRRRRD